MASNHDELPSMAVFSPQSKAPQEAYLDELRSYLCGKVELRHLLESIEDLPNTWSIFAKHNPDIAALSQGLRYTQALADWVKNGNSSRIANVMSGILSLPLLTIIQVVQYFQFLEVKRLRHSDFIARLRDRGGVQGYCGGLMPAIAIACSASETEVAINASKAMYIALGVGAYGELGDDENVEGPTTIVVRLKYAGQAQEIIEDFPDVRCPYGLFSCANLANRLQAHISAITDPKTISIVGTAPSLAEIQTRAKARGMQTQAMHLRGKVHNPENADLARELCALCDQHESLRLPDASHLKAPLRSNKNGKKIREGSLTHEAIETILASCCQWYDLLIGVCSDLEKTETQVHLFAAFGIGDCIPLAPFHKAGLQITKLDILSFIKALMPPVLPVSDFGPKYAYPSDAVAVVGMACRLPGANNIEELWDLISSGTSTVKRVPQDRVDIAHSFRALQDPKWAAKQQWWGNFISDIGSFDHSFFRMSPREAASMDPQQRILLETAYQAMESSGYLGSHQRERGDPVGVFLGASFVEYLDNTSANPPTAYTSTGTIRAFLSGKISYHFGWTGPSEILDTACSSSLVAINRACKAIQHDECSIALTGGVNLITGIHNYLDLAKAGFLSPTGQCKPFDSAADGYCRSEGVGLVVLKRLNQALADQDQILGVIPGASTNQGGLSPSLTVPHSAAQVKLYRNILHQAGMRPEQVSYSEAHGTGTQAGDPLEVASVREVFGSPERQYRMQLGSIKGNNGHCETAAGVAGLLKALVMVNKAAIPPLASHKSLNPKIPALESDKLAISSSLESWKASPRAALVNSYGAAGSNSAVLVCQAPDSDKQHTRWSPPLDFAYPVILSAASKTSLAANAEKLAAFLANAASKCTIADVAFTLVERRKRHPLRFVSIESSIEGLIKSLRSMQNPLDAPQPKKVVLTFSGQSRQSVGLNKTLYESFPLFRHHLDACDELLQQSGFSSCIPAIFDKDPIGDVVTLQCGMFAVQYACAMSWIHSGLQVEAVVGHSFGELTALAVSGVLSLKDAVKLVATRAVLMKSKWGPHRGTMLLVGATTDVVKRLIAGSQDVEIACHNAPATQIVVGTESAISKVEDLVKQGPEYGGIKIQRLDVTHGFHSQFTEPLLKDLSDVAKSLVFKEPSIHLESCTSEELHQVGPERIVQHTREPVFFYHAVRRLEQRFGSCLWLEAGFDSPITSMVKRAVDVPERHHFQDMKTPSGTNPTVMLPTITTKIWQEGASSSFWGFRPLHETNVKQMWLPPYQFERSNHWMPYIDHALEISENQAVGGKFEPVVETASKPLQLIEHRTQPKEDGEYTMNTRAQRYIDIVSGHAVLNRPLCPAAMYMECAVMAAQLSLGKTESSDLWFENLTFDAPLGVDHGRDVTVVLKKDGANKAWSFVARSVSKADPKPKPTLHAKGNFGFSTSTRLDRYERLMTSRIGQLKEQSGTEKLKSKRAYELFSRIVRYAELLKGISSITLGDSEALAMIDVPLHGNTNDSTATGLCDTVTLDAFIQVAGLLINSSDQCSGDQVFVATGVENFSMTSACDFDRSKQWIVFAMFTPLGDGKAMGDVFILTRDNVLVMTVMGVQFTRLPITRLEKLLDAANPKSRDAPVVKQPQPHFIDSTPDTSSQKQSDSDSDEDGLRSGVSSATSVDSDSETAEDDGAAVKTLKSLIASYVGLAEDAISDDANIADLGVDSLAATELADEVSNTFSKDVAGDDLMMMTFGELCQMVAPQRVAKPSKASNSAPPQSSPPPSVLPGKPEDTKPVAEALSKASPAVSDTTVVRSDPIHVLRDCDSMFYSFADKHGFTDYWDSIAPTQNKLVLTYIGEELRKLNCDLWTVEAGAILPSIEYLPKHEQVVQRLWDILNDHGIVYRYDNKMIRSSKPLPTIPSTDLLNEIIASFPKYANENRLMSVTAPHFADGLTGKTDHIGLLFGNQFGQECLSDFYNNSPQLSVMTSHLLNFFDKLLEESAPEGTLRILEVGAGFGGTTKRLAELLERSGRPVEYTFTDISALLVKEARKKFSRYAWMDFQSLNLERDPPASLQGTYDIVIGTNVVHATSSIVGSTKRLRSLLKKGGFIVLSEVTRIVDWYDLVYGLLDGWWAFKDSRIYPLQPADDWVNDLQEAGFETVSYSKGETEESNTQQLIIGSTRPSKVPLTSEPVKARLRQSYRIETMPYKTVDDTEIPADVYFPEISAGTEAMPIGNPHLVVDAPQADAYF